MEIIFCKTRHVYDSYADYHKLVELSGFKSCFVDEIDFAKEIFYIVSPINGEFRPHMAHMTQKVPSDQKKCKVAWWNLERPDSTDGNMTLSQCDDVIRLCDFTFVSDRYYQTLDNRMTYVMMASHAGLAESQPSNYLFDFCHLSYISHRRTHVIGPLIDAKYKIGPNSWGKERDFVLTHSKSMLNIHQTPSPIGEPLRFALAAAYKIPLITETLSDPYPLTHGDDCLITDLKNLHANLKNWLHMAGLKNVGQNLHNRLCVETNFRKEVEETVKKLVG
jgi:hypothetical protein